MTDDLGWPGFREEQFYNFLRHKYGDFKKLEREANDKRKAADKMPEGDPLYHRAQVSAEMASLRVDMAAIVDRNNRLEEMIGTVEYLHQRVGILEGAYGHLKLLAETGRNDYAVAAGLYKKIHNIIKEHENGAAQGSHKPDGKAG